MRDVGSTLQDHIFSNRANSLVNLGLNHAVVPCGVRIGRTHGNGFRVTLETTRSLKTAELEYAKMFLDNLLQFEHRGDWAVIWGYELSMDRGHLLTGVYFIKFSTLRMAEWLGPRHY